MIVVTGGAGFIGSHLVELLLERTQDEILVLDKLTYAGKQRYVPENQRVMLVEGDVTDRTTVHQVLSRGWPDAVIHLAAETHVSRSIDKQTTALFIDTNVLGTFVLLDEMLALWEMQANMLLRQDFRFLYVSTDEVYGSLELREAKWTESSPLLPNNPYSASKAAAEMLVRSYAHTYGFPTIVTRGSNTYGPRQHPEKLIPAVIEAAFHGKEIVVHGDGQNVRDWLYVKDHATGILAALQHGKPGGVYNIGGNCERTNMEIISLVLRTMAQNHNVDSAKIYFGEDRPGNDRRYAMSTALARTVLGWSPTVLTIEDAIATVIYDYLEDTARD